MSRLFVGVNLQLGQCLTRQGISLIVLPGHVPIGHLPADDTPWMSSLHVAMQMGPSHHPMSRTSGVWSLRILRSSGLGFLRFIVCMISAIPLRPRWVR